MIGGTRASGVLDYSVPITAAFFLPGGGATAAVTNSVSVASDLVPIAGAITLQGFDINGALIASATQADGLVLSLAAAGIHSVRFFSQSATVAFDNFTFGALTAPPESGNGVPTPATLALFGLGLLGFGALRRRLNSPYVKDCTEPRP